MEQYKQLTNTSLNTIVSKYLRDKILLGELKGGERIVESDIADLLGISRAPVRESIQELASQGLIKSIPRKGNFVVKFTMSDVAEIFDIRLLMENSVIEILINEDKLTNYDISRLKAIVDEMTVISKGEDEFANKMIMLNEKDVEFHSYLWQRSGSARRVKILQDLHLQLRIAMVIDTKLTGNLDKTARDHYEIIKHLEQKDIENCVKAIRDHIISQEKPPLKRLTQKSEGYL
ncbi:GntR family transcriptional regulator [Desulforamulus aquiferis]|uniref:GntR family transcriptional regulator n=1 Tax=Desulforamulus aquiferis TaxID=1397668 RepID=A0AAW7ZFB5_9FIRM|nr:GntR family transcriptional regulator [Desulforamulus aquiferis]MDO7787859.1 GntR family transcriptional regulator [Desulforamulus aquiferis]